MAPRIHLLRPPGSRHIRLLHDDWYLSIKLYNKIKNTNVFRSASRGDFCLLNDVAPGDLSLGSRIILGEQFMDFGLFTASRFFKATIQLSVEQEDRILRGEQEDHEEVTASEPHRPNRIRYWFNLEWNAYTLTTHARIAVHGGPVRLRHVGDSRYLLPLHFCFELLLREQSTQRHGHRLTERTSYWPCLGRWGRTLYPTDPILCIDIVQSPPTPDELGCTQPQPAPPQLHSTFHSIHHTVLLSDRAATSGLHSSR